MASRLVKRGRRAERRTEGKEAHVQQLATLLAQANRDDVDTPALVIGIVSLALGILILVMPRLLNYIVAGYLIIVGVLALIGAFD